jgi:protein TonB
MTAIPFTTPPPERPETRRPHAASAGRVAAYALAVAAHAGVMALVGLQATPTPDGGAAPVINLTLEPSPRFDSETPPAAASTAESAARAKARSAPVVSPLRLRETPAPLPSDLTLPLPSRVAEPTPRARDAREPGEQQGAAQVPDGAGSGRASTDNSVAGATQGGGGQALGAAAAADTDLYAAQVLAWIERHKRHPGGGRGVVTVTFRLDRQGRVHGLRLVRSSGVRALDRAAMDQILATQPFPRPGAGVRWVRREFTVNIDYRARPGG